MKFVGRDNKSFELWVIDYQFPGNTMDEYDSNWLRIGTRLEGFKEGWITSDPSLLTWEIKYLMGWFEQILTGPMYEHEIRFIEPNLRFEVINATPDSLVIKTHLALESKPSWFTEDDTFFFNMDVDRGQIVSAVEDLQKELATFPARAGVNL